MATPVNHQKKFTQIGHPATMMMEVRRVCFQARSQVWQKPRWPICK